METATKFKAGKAKKLKKAPAAVLPPVRVRQDVAIAAAATTTGSGRTAWARNLAAPIRSYLHAETGGAVVLAAAAVAALLWANVAPDSYDVGVGDAAGARARRPRAGHRPARLGQRGPDDAVLPRRRARGQARARPRRAARAHAGWRSRSSPSLGGMVTAAAIYLAINAGGDGARGWGAAVSTDTALALGALALLTRGRAIRLRVFLLTLVVIDDLVALLVIALGYTEDVSVTALAVAIGLFGVLLALRWAGSWRGPAAVLVGIGIWLAMFESGVDAVIAGPGDRPGHERLPAGARRARAQHRAHALVPRAADARAGLLGAREPDVGDLAQRAPAVPPAPVDEPRDRAAVRARQRRHPARRRPALGGASRSPVTLGIIAAYVVGKPLGHPGRDLAGDAPMLGGARLTITWPALIGAAASAGIGFTVSLLVATLAFDGRAARARPRSACWRPRSSRPALAWVAVPGHAAAARPSCARASSARRPRRSSTSPTTSTPSATTSAAASTRRSRCSSTATSSAPTAATRRR